LKKDLLLGVSFLNASSGYKYLRGAHTRSYRSHVITLALLLVCSGVVVTNCLAGGVFPTDTQQLAFFYKPPYDNNADTLAQHFDNYILTKMDEPFRDILKSKGVTCPFLQYIRVDAIMDPGSCTAQPYRNQAADQIGDFCDINSNHSDWFLYDTNGNKIISDGYYMMDPGNQGWRDFFLSRVKPTQETLGWDGIFLDNVEASFGKREQQGQIPKKYTETTYTNAIKDFLSFLYNSYFKTTGRPMHGNIITVKDPAVWFSYLTYMDGAMQESFAVDWSTGYRSLTEWEEHLSRAEQTQSSGKRVLLIAQGPETDGARQNFSYGSYLLVANGKAAFRYTDGDYYREYWLYSNYDIDLGTPLGPRYEQNGIWYRDFTQGKVTVDPNAHTAIIDQNSGPPKEYVDKEAEDGSLSAPMKKYSDSAASLGYYVVTPDKTGNNKGKDGISFSVSSTDTYYVWARVISPNSGSNSFNVQMDGGTKTPWGLPIQTSWKSINMPNTYYLSSGSHTITFWSKEDGTKLDKVVITNDPDYVP
jgi:hypothetical protein